MNESKNNRSNKFSIEVTEDRKYAYLTVKDFSDLTKKMIYDELIVLKVIHGVEFTRINKVFEDNKEVNKVIIAKYTKVRNAIDDKIEFFIDLELKPKELKLKIDYYDLGFIKDVKKGTKIFEYTKGRDYSNGKLIDLTTIKDEKIDEKTSIDRTKLNVNEIINENCSLVELKNSKYICYSKINGSLIVSKDNSKIEVLDTINIENGVNFKTGHLISEFSNFNIRGDVLGKFILKTPKDIYIDGNVENCEIYANNLTVTNGIKKGDNTIHIKNELISKEITRRKNIYVKQLKVNRGLFSTEIGVNGDADIYSVGGGELFVYGNLNVDVLGSDTATHTIVVMGEDKFKFDNFLKKNRELRRQKVFMRNMREEKVKLSNEITEVNIRERKTKDDSSKEYFSNIVLKLNDDLDLLERDYNLEEEKELEIMKEYNLISEKESNKTSVITVKKKLHPGTVIKFGMENRIRIIKEYDGCIIKLNKENGIEIISN